MSPRHLAGWLQTQRCI